jgi:hypothetical protein
LHAAGSGGQPKDIPLSRLVELGARVSGSRLEDVERLSATLLGGSNVGHWRSTLNNDGSPLQVGVSLPRQGAHPAVRLIADPAAEPADGQRRWRRAALALEAVLASNAPNLKPLCDSVVSRLLPVEPAVRDSLPGGAIWLAADLSGRGMALYATARWGEEAERWLRAHRWLTELLPDASVAHDTVARLARHAVLVSVGVEGVTAGDARAKLYWRLTGASALLDLGVPLLDSAVLFGFLSEAVGDRRISRTAIVGSIGFRVASGRVSDAKLDVCGHCVPRSRPEWVRAIQRLIARHELAAPPVDVTALLGSVELAFIGFGLDAERAPRLNVYLKRSWP